jgi:putative CocE/NonD family hydrolase
LTQATIDFDVPARMRDGVILRANVYRPVGDGPWPTLLMRLPYGKDDPSLVSRFDPIHAVRSGFMVVIQDTRGRFASDGDWDPFAYEREDGYDSVEWAASLPGSNGRVGMCGESYYGYTQWAAAIEQPPSLAAIAPGLTWSDPMDGLFARGGAVELGVALPWTLQQGPDHVARLPIPKEDRSRRVEALLDDYDRLPEEGYWELPINESSVLRRHAVPELGALRALDDSTIAERSRVSDHYDRVAVPSLHIGGWYDVFVQGTLDNFAAMAARGRDARLLVGPWSHVSFTDPIGEQFFGVRASRFGVPVDQHGDLGDLQLAWFRRHLVPDPSIAFSDASVRLFVMGRNAWRDESSWPPTGVSTERHFLRADGSLTVDSPSAEEPPTEFIYDPADPAPALGGQTVMRPFFPSGPMDQRSIESRSDVCVFTSEPLSEELEVTGRVRVVLHAASSAPSTDWVARLCDVHPDGRSFNLCDGIVRVTGTPDGCERHEIDLWSTANVFLAGHQLRVHVTSSSFPRWDRNLNTGDQRASGYKSARQRVFHDSESPSYVELPVRS